jgi:protein arginine kinase
MSRLGNVFKTIIDHEINARFKYLEDNRARLLDQVGRAFGILQNAHVLNSNEAMNLLSLMRLAVDFGMLPEDNRTDVDRLFIECQPGHVQYAKGEGIEPDARDLCRADKLREEFARLPSLDFDKVKDMG